jgi:hypothetical protein
MGPTLQRTGKNAQRRVSIWDTPPTPDVSDADLSTVSPRPAHASIVS